MYHHKTGVVLRKIEQSDLKELLNLKNESWWATHKVSFINEQDQLKWFENISKTDLFMLILKDDEKIGFMSYVNVDPMSRICQISGSAFRSASKKHCMKTCLHCCIDFAFEMLNMHRIEMEIIEYNLISQKLNIECGNLKIEGKKRESVYKCGKYYDSLVLGLLRTEWEEEERVKEYGGSCNLNFNHQKMDKLIQRSPYLE